MSLKFFLNLQEFICLMHVDSFYLSGCFAGCFDIYHCANPGCYFVGDGNFLSTEATILTLSVDDLGGETITFF